MLLDAVCFIQGICNGYTMCARDLTDIYTQSPRAAGWRAEGVYVSQIPRTHGITISHHSTKTAYYLFYQKYCTAIFTDSDIKN